VIFNGEDDQKTDPEGNAGARIACGVIQAAGSAPAAASAVSIVSAGLIVLGYLLRQRRPAR
jgi:hypothetical protein